MEANQKLDLYRRLLCLNFEDIGTPGIPVFTQQTSVASAWGLQSKEILPGFSNPGRAFGRSAQIDPNQSHGLATSKKVCQADIRWMLFSKQHRV